MISIHKLNRNLSSLARSRAHSRGMTLIEIMVVIAIIGIMGGAVAYNLLGKASEAQEKVAEQSAKSLRGIVQTWRISKGAGDCPTMTQLAQDKQIDAESKGTDPWGQPFTIQCTDDETVVTSSGKDKKPGTADDIIVPKAAKKN